MRWFKHVSDASDDEFIVELEDVFGLEGYARWFKLVEAVACKAEKNKASVAFPWSKWQTILKGKQNKLGLFLEHCEKKGKIKQKQTGNILEIEVCKLLKYRDEYSRKSGQAPDELPRKEVEVEVEVDTEKEVTPLALTSSEAHVTGEVVINLILNDATDYPIHQSVVDEFVPLYPSVDVVQELREMRGWCISNPSKRKTKSGIMRFVTTWLAKAQDTPGRNSQAPPGKNKSSLYEQNQAAGQRAKQMLFGTVEVESEASGV